jgi:2-polyprenyl-3-methyl-5-hydroxy-6-metoxy-1,4-benzoquinol methylase
MDKNYVQNLTEEEWSSKIDRIIVSESNPYTLKTYFNRYAFVAAKILKGYENEGTLETPVVIDCACGDGAGSAFLAEQFSGWDVSGIDIDQLAIDHANKTYQASNLKYFCMGIDSMAHPPADVFVSLETMEHITKRTMTRALERIAGELLKPGGVFVTSMPRLRPRESTVRRPGHINELYYQEFKYILGQHFPMLDFYCVDRYANIVPDSPDANCMIAICTKWPETKIF